MSPQGFFEVRDKTGVYVVGCPTCQAPPGHACRGEDKRRGGYYVVAPHTARDLHYRQQKEREARS